MTEFTLLQLVKETIMLSFLLCMPILVLGTLVGVLVSIFQTATSIQDQSLSFIPKLLVTFGSIVVLGPWMLSQVMQFAIRLLSSLQQFAR
jgi:flagellar biosynthetic protein FliQ